MLKFASHLLKTQLTSTCVRRSAHSLSNVSLSQTLHASETNVTELDNGLRVASEDNGLQTCTVGVYIDAGTRYEPDNANGVAHFAEHMSFRGTQKRTAAQLETEIENMGAYLNAYTSREQMVFYAKCLSKDMPKAVEILGDIIQNATFDEKEIERERGVILRQLQEMESNNQEVVFDHLHSVAFQGTPLGRSVCGPTENIKTINRNDLINYVTANYKGPRIVLAVAGGVQHDQLVKAANEHFGKIKYIYDNSEIPLLKPCRFTGSDIRVRDDDMNVAYVAIGLEGVGWDSPDFIPLMVAKELIGSWDRSHGGGINASSFLATASVADHLAHCFESFYIPYRDTGLWGIYFVCERMSQEEFMWYLQREWKRLSTSSANNLVTRGKNAVKTNLLMQLDGTTPLCDTIGKELLNFGRRIPLSEWEAKIEAVNATSVREVCNRYIWDRCPAIAAIGPVENLPLYEEVRAGMKARYLY